MLERAQHRCAPNIAMPTVTPRPASAWFSGLDSLHLSAFAYRRQDASTSGFGRLPGAQFISCSSDNMRRNYCAADVRGGVQLVKQRSDAPCLFNRTWGYVKGRGIWVDRGCRADFQIGGNGGGGGGKSRRP
jgi:hypothetical protein